MASIAAISREARRFVGTGEALLTTFGFFWFPNDTDEHVELVVDAEETGMTQGGGGCC